MKAVKLLIALLYAGLLFQNAFSQGSDHQLHPNGEKLFSFGIIADPQYADAETSGSRYYRNSLSKLNECVDELNNQELSFTIQLGDLIDHDYSSFDSILPILNKLNEPVYNVIGNHDFSVDEKFRKKVRGRLNNDRGYFSYSIDDFVFIVLDGTDISTFGTKQDIRQYRLGKGKCVDLNESDSYAWNGSIGNKQLKWLEKNLKKANQNKKKVILFCHYPLLSDEVHQLQNSKKVLSLINNYECVVAWISGHNHAGGYTKTANFHHLIIKGMVETMSESSFGVMDIYTNKLVLNGYDNQEDLILEF